MLAIDNSLIFKSSSSVRFFAPSGNSLRVWRNEPVAYVLDRPLLESKLVERAQAAGADYLFGTQATDVQLRKEGLCVGADFGGQKKAFESKTAVIATGFGSSLSRKLGMGKITDFIAGAQAEVKINSIDEVQVYFDQRLAPGGFAWLVPTRDNKGLAGLITHKQPGTYIETFLAKLKEQNKIASTKVIASYGAIPLRPLPRTYARRILVIGEAAGQVKPITGGGIYYGLLCADIAVQTLHQASLAGDFSKSKLASYQKNWRAKLGKELRTGYWAHRLYCRLDNRQIERLYHLANNTDISRFIAEMKGFSFDWHSNLILEILKRLAFRYPVETGKTLAKHP
jgi:flavin-dependent dehydrogenase